MKSRSKAGHSEKNYSIACNAVQFANLKLRLEKVNE